MRISDWSSDVCSSDLAVKSGKLSPENRDKMYTLRGQADAGWNSGLGLLARPGIAPELETAAAAEKASYNDKLVAMREQATSAVSAGQPSQVGQSEERRAGKEEGRQGRTWGWAGQ